MLLNLEQLPLTGKKHFQLWGTFLVSQNLFCMYIMFNWSTVDIGLGHYIYRIILVFQFHIWTQYGGCWKISILEHTTYYNFCLKYTNERPKGFKISKNKLFLRKRVHHSIHSLTRLWRVHLTGKKHLNLRGTFLL